MKTGKMITALVVILGLMLFSQAATADTNASILYNETALDNGYWQYDYTFANLSTNNEYLYGVQLYFGNLYEVSDTRKGDNWGGSWGMLSSTFFLETHSSNYADDIAAGDSLSGFSFTTKNQLGNVSYASFFDDQKGNRSYTTGISTAGSLSSTPDVPVVPEPVSTVLFLTGGATMAFRYRQKRKRESGK